MSRILVAGSWLSSVHEAPAAIALERLGHEVHRFRWAPYFGEQASFGSLSLPRGLLGRLQHRYLVGPALGHINRDLIDIAARLQPDIVLIYRGTPVLRETVAEIGRRAPRAIRTAYNNDDPFSAAARSRTWRHLLRAIPEYDLVLAYRDHNIPEYERLGARRVRLLRSWFVPEVHRPIQLTPAEKALYECDAVFIGHYEEDGRLQTLETLAAAGLHVRIFGPGKGMRGSDWDRALSASRYLRHLPPVRTVWGDEYAKALRAARVALCFLSKRNRDTYTRRCFEIPAVGALLMSEYSADLASLFREGVEAEFFRNSSELLAKLGLYLRDADRREAVAAAGRCKVWHAGHDVVSRMHDLMHEADSLRRSDA